MKVFCILMFVIIIKSSIGYTFTCPHPSQWTRRANAICNNEEKYVCTWDVHKKTDIEKCHGEKKERKGNWLVYNNNNLERKPCPQSRFQPELYTTYGNSQCVFSKSFCSEEGQIKVGNGTSWEDVKCSCDYRKGYAFINRSAECDCNPFSEDCSCFKKRCEDREVLSPDYQCIKEVVTTGSYRCRSLSTINENDANPDIVSKGHSDHADSLSRGNVYVGLVIFLLLLMILGIVLLIKYMKGKWYSLLRNIRARFRNHVNGDKESQDMYLLDSSCEISDVSDDLEIYIYDIKYLTDDVFVISDHKSDQILTCNIKGEVIKKIPLPNPPFHLGIISTESVAVTLREVYVFAVINIKQGEISRTIDVNAKCAGIVYHNDKFYVGCYDRKIRVLEYNSGELIDTMESSIIPYHIGIVNDCIYYIQYNNNELQCREFNGKIKFRYTTDLESTTGLTIDENGYLLVICDRNGTVHRISPDGKQREVVIAQSISGSEQPFINYSSLSKSLVIAYGQTILLFKRKP